MLTKRVCPVCLELEKEHVYWWNIPNCNYQFVTLHKDRTEVIREGIESSMPFMIKAGRVIYEDLDTQGDLPAPADRAGVEETLGPWEFEEDGMGRTILYKQDVKDQYKYFTTDKGAVICQGRIGFHQHHVREEEADRKEEKRTETKRKKEEKKKETERKEEKKKEAERRRQQKKKEAAEKKEKVEGKKTKTQMTEVTGRKGAKRGRPEQKAKVGQTILSSDKEEDTFNVAEFTDQGSIYTRQYDRAIEWETFRNKHGLIIIKGPVSFTPYSFPYSDTPDEIFFHDFEDKEDHRKVDPPTLHRMERDANFAGPWRYMW
ncbi:hypothetical protein PM082_022717 [Marasmius tenuissimus]|nr:hypothetical protein PM082_022717 [Marasmius tenuissimus]